MSNRSNSSRRGGRSGVDYQCSLPKAKHLDHAKNFDTLQKAFGSCKMCLQYLSALCKTFLGVCKFLFALCKTFLGSAKTGLYFLMQKIVFEKSLAEAGIHITNVYVYITHTMYIPCPHLPPNFGASQRYL